MSGLRKNLCQIEAIEQGRDTERQRPAPRARRRGRSRPLRFDPMLEPPEHALDVRWSAAAHPYWHSAHLPRTSMTGRSAAKPVFSRSEEHTSELQSLMRISYAVFCLKKKKEKPTPTHKSDTQNT